MKTNNVRITSPLPEHETHRGKLGFINPDHALAIRDGSAKLTEKVLVILPDDTRLNLESGELSYLDARARDNRIWVQIKPLDDSAPEPYSYAGYRGTIVTELSREEINHLPLYTRVTVDLTGVGQALYLLNQLQFLTEEEVAPKLFVDIDPLACIDSPSPTGWLDRGVTQSFLAELSRGDDSPELNVHFTNGEVMRIAWKDLLFTEAEYLSRSVDQEADARNNVVKLSESSQPVTTRTLPDDTLCDDVKPVKLPILSGVYGTTLARRQGFQTWCMEEAGRTLDSMQALLDIMRTGHRTLCNDDAPDSWPDRRSRWPVLEPVIWQPMTALKTATEQHAALIAIAMMPGRELEQTTHPNVEFWYGAYVARVNPKF